MTLTEIQELDDAEVGKQIAVCLGWKIIESVVIENGYVETLDGLLTRPHLLCVSLDSIASAEKIAVPQMVNFSQYGGCLKQVVFVSVFVDKNTFIHHFATLTARKRAEALLFALITFAGKRPSSGDNFSAPLKKDAVSL